MITGATSASAMLVASDGGWTPHFGAWKPTDWSALAAWVTVTIAVVAASVAWRQLHEARRLRREQAQPYVVLYMEPSAASAHFIDLILKNLGKTAASDVRVTTTPALKRSVQGGGVDDVWLPESIPVLVPGQEWRVFWDAGFDRLNREDLPLRYEATVTFTDSTGKSYLVPSVLDWSAHKGHRWATVYGAHDAAKALQEISKTLGKWQEDLHGGLAVFVRSGDAKDEQERERYEEFLGRQQAKREADDDDDGSPS